MSDTDSTKNERLIYMPKAVASHKRCVVCQKKISKGNKQQSKIVSQESVIQSYIETVILIKRGCRTCPTHFILNTKRFNDGAIEVIQPVSEEVNLDSDEDEQLLIKLDRINKNSIIGQFKDPYLPSNQTFIRT